jgi:hypothetical protein
MFTAEQYRANAGEYVKLVETDLKCRNRERLEALADHYVGVELTSAQKQLKRKIGSLVLDVLHLPRGPLSTRSA